MASPEHTFEEDVLERGDNLASFTVDGDISQRKAVKINGDKQVTQIGSAGDQMEGVALFGVSDGEEVTIALDGCEVDVEIGAGGATAGNSAAVDGDGNFEDASGTDTSVVGTFYEGGSDGDVVTLYIDTTVGFTLA